MRFVQFSHFVESRRGFVEAPPADRATGRLDAVIDPPLPGPLLEAQPPLLRHEWRGDGPGGGGNRSRGRYRRRRLNGRDPYVRRREDAFAQGMGCQKIGIECQRRVDPLQRSGPVAAIE